MKQLPHIIRKTISFKMIPMRHLHASGNEPYWSDHPNCYGKVLVVTTPKPRERPGKLPVADIR